jgi:hypothetical protein
VTLTVEDLESGVKEVSLTGNADYKCEQGGKVEEKKYQVEPQTQKASPDLENKARSRRRSHPASITASMDARNTNGSAAAPSR